MTMTMDASIKWFNSLHSSYTNTFESLEFQYHKPGLISLIFLVLWITTAIVSICVQYFDYSDLVRFTRLWSYCFGMYDFFQDDDDDDDDFLNRIAE
ncbi:hypothetical protein K0M31_011556 [Melipona bicolor]|uniref:Uncharacterized protein n=1 Tax=Melipona bicolor TaxID=60889 RepID=A0AA40G9T2_9HYME|nr:hypothetical protein K0M31_011556 [Melipona bicolor]